jgi:hypothetical protein
MLSKKERKYGAFEGKYKDKKAFLLIVPGAGIKRHESI